MGKIHKEDRQENDIKNRVNKGRAITSMLNAVPDNRQITIKSKLQIQWKLRSRVKLKYRNLTKIQNQKLCRWKWIF